MAIKIKKVSKVVLDTGIKVAVHGLAGSGKTVLCATAGEPTLIISVESGLLSLKDAPDYVYVAVVKKISDLDEIYDILVDDLLTEGGPKFKWIAIDSASEIAEQILSTEKETAKDPRAAYMTMQDEIMKLFRKFRDIPNYNVIMTFKQERIDDDGKKIYAPMMPGTKLSQQVPYMFDLVFALRVENDKEDKSVYRVLQTSRDSKYEAKDRSGLLDMFEPPNLKKIAKKIKSQSEEVKEAAEKITKLIEEIVEDPETDDPDDRTETEIDEEEEAEDE